MLEQGKGVRSPAAEKEEVAKCDELTVTPSPPALLGGEGRKSGVKFSPGRRKESGGRCF